MSSVHSRRLISKTIQASGYGKFGMNDNERKLEIAKGIIARLKDNLEDQKATITQLTASNTSKQNIIDEMVEDGCCRAFVDEIMSDAEKDCAKALQESKDAIREGEGERRRAFGYRRLLHIATKTIFSDQFSMRLDDYYDPYAVVGSIETIVFEIGEADIYDEEERLVLDIVQGSPEDRQKEGERQMLAEMVVEHLDDYADWFRVCSKLRKQQSNDYWQVDITKIYQPPIL
tara:strand:- start:790 stop:1482 length:693 start_codon:yes stop_codon:yes gene_type:complete